MYLYTVMISDIVPDRFITTKRERGNGMAFHPPGPEAKQRAKDQRQRDLTETRRIRGKRLAELAESKPDGIWAEMLTEHLALYGEDGNNGHI
jgi:hypothetical protein